VKLLIDEHKEGENDPESEAGAEHTNFVSQRSRNSIHTAVLASRIFSSNSRMVPKSAERTKESLDRWAKKEESEIDSKGKEMEKASDTEKFDESVAWRIVRPWQINLQANDSYWGVHKDR
jgi:hypothetical protein